MMGKRMAAQEALFYGFSLERHVPAGHLLRLIDRFVDLSGLREQLRPFYSETGRPSIDPELIIRMLLVGYCFGIRSERRLCRGLPRPEHRGSGGLVNSPQAASARPSWTKRARLPRPRAALFAIVSNTACASVGIRTMMRSTCWSAALYCSADAVCCSSAPANCCLSSRVETLFGLNLLETAYEVLILTLRRASAHRSLLRRSPR